MMRPVLQEDLVIDAKAGQSSRSQQGPGDLRQEAAFTVRTSFLTCVLAESGVVAGVIELTLAME